MATQNSKRDNNRVTTLIGVDNVGFTEPTTIAVDPTTHALVIGGSITATVDTTGLATSAKQDTGNTSIASIDTKTPALGQALAASSVPVVLTAAQLTTLTPLSSVAVTQSTSPWVVSGAVTNTVLSVVGSGTEAAAQRVTLATDSTGVITVKQGTASNLKVAATLDAETTKVIGTVRTLGNVGAVMDGVNTAATAPANGLLTLGIYNSTEPSPTTGQSVGVQLDAKGRTRSVLMDAAGNTRGANVDANSNLGVVLAAETTKVLGVTRTADGAGNLLTTNSTTYTAKFGLDANLLGTLGTAFSTAGKVDVKVASGDIASGAIASGAVASGAYASGSVSDGAVVTLGAKTDAKSSATDGTSITAMQVLKQISASVQAPPSQAVTNAGTFATQESGTWVQVDDAAFTPATSKIAMAGYEADETSTDSVDEGDGGAARMTLDRKQIVTLQPHTAGGVSTMNATSSDGATALTNSSQVLSAAAGQVYGWYIFNPNSATAYVQFYNTASASVTVGTTNPLFMISVPAGQATNVNWPQGITFSNAGFSWSATSTAGGNGALTTALDAVCFYK